MLTNLKSDLLSLSFDDKVLLNSFFHILNALDSSMKVQ